jgi:hypothetical protein
MGEKRGFFFNEKKFGMWIRIRFESNEGPTLCHTDGRIPN